MALFIDGLKLKAAAGSLHQFCPAVRTIFPNVANDEVVEAATAFLYLQLAEGVFGRRFGVRLRRRLRSRFKFASPVEIETHLDRIGHNFEQFQRRAMRSAPPRNGHEAFTLHVRSAIQALLVEAGLPAEDGEMVRATFPRFEAAARRVRDHLLGIRQQSRFVLKS